MDEFDVDIMDEEDWDKFSNWVLNELLTNVSSNYCLLSRLKNAPTSAGRASISTAVRASEELSAHSDMSIYGSARLSCARES